LQVLLIINAYQSSALHLLLWTGPLSGANCMDWTPTKKDLVAG